MKKKLFTSLLSLCLALSLTAAPAAALSTEEAKELLRDYYVDQIPEEVLALDSLDAILEALDDPYTVYMTAEEYQQFLSSVNGDTVVGIGVSIENTFNDGYQIMAILPDSPALEAGLEAGDRIIAVNGEALTQSTDIVSRIAGEEGTSVTITVIRQSNGQTKDFTLTRRSVVIPIVTYDAQGNAGVISCISFGSSTVETVHEALESLDDDISVWIMDLRSNPGGTAEAASGSAGLFVGGEIMVYFRNAQGEYNYIYTLPTCPDLTDKPLILLTSPYSASGSELFAAAARDHGFGISIGQRTFGKGIAQMVFDESVLPELFDGDAMKITVYRFYSPDGATNQTVGILPTLLISPEHTQTTAMLLTAPKSSRAGDCLKLELAGHTFYIHRDKAINDENRAAFTELLEALPPAAALYEGSGSYTWQETSPAQLAQELGLDYAGRTFPDIQNSPFQRQIDTLASYRLVSGYDDGGFHPEAPITRAEFCAMVANTWNLPVSEIPAPFSDVPGTAWYADTVSAMTAKGFIVGFGDGTFRPDSTITQQEMVTILAAVAEWSSMEGSKLMEEEIPISEWLNYYTYSSWAQIPARTLDRLGALTGGLAPTAPVTREVAAGSLCALLEGLHLLWQ